MKTLAAVLLVLAASPLLAQQKKRAEPPPISLTETSAQLARNGATQGNPRAVMAAAEILRVVERGTPRVQRASPLDGPLGPWEGPMSSTALLRLASRMATDQDDWGTAEYAAWLLQLPDSVPVTRGAAGGPVWADSYLGAGREVRYTIEFEGGQTPNMLQVSAGKAGSVLRCAVREAGDSARPAVRGRSLAGTCSIEWQQGTRSKMTLQIRNAGPATYFVVSSN